MLIDLSAIGTQAELASIVGVTQPNISALMTEGKLPSGLPLGETIQAYCFRLREQAAGRMGSEVGALDLPQERAALARAQRHLAEAKLQISRGTFASIGILSEVLAAASQSIVERFDQLPGMLKKACPDLPDAAREQVMVALASARNEWVRATEQLVTQKAAEIDGDDPDTDDSGDALEAAQ